MPQGQCHAFVLGSSVLNEQDKLVHLFTLDRGNIKAIAPGACKAKSRFGSTLEILTEGSFVYYWKEEKELITLQKGEIIQSHFSLVSDAHNIFYFYLVAEIILKLIPPQQKETRAYKLVKATLEHREKGVSMPQSTLYFLIWILRIEGMMFRPDSCVNCQSRQLTTAWVRSDYRGLLCHQCRTNEITRLTSDELEYIKTTESQNPAVCDPWKDKIDIAKLIRIFVQKIQYHSEITFTCPRYLPEFR